MKGASKDEQHKAGGESMPRFHETPAGEKFLKCDFPNFIKAINRLADAIEKMNGEAGFENEKKVTKEK